MISSVGENNLWTIFTKSVGHAATNKATATENGHNITLTFINYDNGKIKF